MNPFEYIDYLQFVTKISHATSSEFSVHGLTINRLLGKTKQFVMSFKLAQIVKLDFNGEKISNVFV